MGIQEIAYSLNMFRIKEIAYSLEHVKLDNELVSDDLIDMNHLTWLRAFQWMLNSMTKYYNNNNKGIPSRKLTYDELRIL